MVRGRSIRQQQQEESHAAANGHCVFYALRVAIRDLPNLDHIRTYAHMLGYIRSKLRADAALLEQVQWCDACLTAQEVVEFTQAVAHVHVGNGYWCGACDPLLACFCAAFRVNVVHDFAGTETTYHVPRARRVVHLSSSVGHMEHRCNQDLSGLASEAEECESASQGSEKLSRQQRARINKRVRKAGERAADIEGLAGGNDSHDNGERTKAGSMDAPAVPDSELAPECAGAFLRRWSFDAAVAGSLYGRPVLVEADSCPLAVGTLRHAQGTSRGKVLTEDGQVVFFPWAGAHLIAFPAAPRDAAEADAQMSTLARRRWSLLESGDHLESCCD